MSGHTPGRGDYSGTATLRGTGSDAYAASYALRYADGEVLYGKSTAILYTGYEWRGTAELGGRSVREVYAASADGTRLVGRWFEAEHAEIGGDWQAVRSDGRSRLVAVIPRALKVGTTQPVSLFGDMLVKLDARSPARIRY